MFFGKSKASRPSRRCLLSLACAGLLGLLPLTATAQDAYPPLGKQSIVWAYGPWGTGRFVTAMGKMLLEKIGYTVDMKLLDVGLSYQAMVSGKADIFSSAYLPGQQAYFEKYGPQLDILSMSYGPVPGGLMVPSYVPFNTIADLQDPNNAALVGGKIIGIDAGSGVMLQADRAVKDYGLKLQLVASSTAARNAAFKAAYDAKKPIIITGWCPDALCSLYNVKFLKDTKGIYSSQSRDYHVVRKGFRTDSPRATEFLSRFSLTDDQMSEAMVWMEQDKIDEQKAAERFISENPQLVWYWIGDLAPDLTKPSL
jgi:glycine betaine/proline transport system substrate-binding protein